ncbi:MAG: FAD-binding oxidoreductase [Candidatus Aramenus sp.]|jgi:FAD/FMN-containing dehydrogenase|nr:FAD-binding oxidoreductase [Candidatus Aramenus sp.]
MELLDVLSREFEVVKDRELLAKYSVDYGYLSPEISRLAKMPLAVVKVRKENDVEKLMELVNEYHFPVVERGKGTNTLGGAMPIKEGSVVVDLSEFKGFEKRGGELVSKPGTEFDEVGIHDLPVVPTSYYMASIGGFVTGGSLGFGSLRNGAVWDNVVGLEVYTPKGRFNLEGEDTYSVVQSAGTTGIVTKVRIKLVRRGRISVKKMRFSSFEEALNRALELVDEAEFVSVRNYAFAKEISDEPWGKWNVIAGLEDEEGEFSFKDVITTFAGAYFTVVSKKQVSYQSYDLPISSLEKVKDLDCMMDAELSRSRGRVFSHTYFLGCGRVEVLGRRFNLHSIKVNHRVEEDRLKKIVEFKRVVDPDDLLNPGKVDF